MPVKMKMVHGNLFPGDVAGFDEDTEAALIESGKAEAVEADSDPAQVGDPPTDPALTSPLAPGGMKAPQAPPTNKMAVPGASVQKADPTSSLDTMDRDALKDFAASKGLAEKIDMRQSEADLRDAILKELE